MVLCEQVGWFVGWGMNVSYVVVVGASASALVDRRVCVEVEDSFHQHALHPIDTYV